MAATAASGGPARHRASRRAAVAALRNDDVDALIARWAALHALGQFGPERMKRAQATLQRQLQVKEYELAFDERRKIPKDLNASR